MESKARFRWWDYPVFLALTAVHLTVLGKILLPWIVQGTWTRAHPILLVVLGTILLDFLLWEWRWFALPLMRVPIPKAPPRGLRVGVGVTFVPGPESIEMLEKTVAALVAMEYPHDTWVLDEGDDLAVRRLCQRLGAWHFTRFGISRYQKPDGRFKSRTKYGNYNAWLEEIGYASYDIVVAFDSDHVPVPDYLKQVLGYFDDKNVAYVQPAQVYSNQGASFIAGAAAEETYAYYSSIQMTAYSVGYPIIVGCHNAHRVTALREIGGFAAHEADDMVMTLLYRAKGWRGVYVPKVLARGLTPVSWTAYLGQQRRWARSVLDFKLRVFPKYAGKLPVLERILTYVHGVYYLRGPIIGLQLGLLAIMLATASLPRGSGVNLLWSMTTIWASVFLCDVYRQRFFLDPKTEVGVHWRSTFVSFVKWPYFVLAFWDAMRAQYGVYTLTPKARRASRAYGFGLTHLVVIGLVSTGWVIDIARGPSSFVVVHIAAAVAVLTSLFAAITSTWTFPPAFQGAAVRRTAWIERAVPVPVSIEYPVLADAARLPVRHIEPVPPAREVRALG